TAALAAAGRLRVENELRGWIEVEDGQIRRYGQLGQGRIGRTTLRAGPRQVVFPAVAFPDLRPAQEGGASWVRFVQTAGAGVGHRCPTGSAAPRSCSSPRPRPGR